MKLSQLLPGIQASFPVEIVNERDFELLALADTALETPFLSFLDTPKYLDRVNPNVSMLLVTPEIQALLGGTAYGVAVTENPRWLYFQLHNWLAEQEGYRRDAFKTVIGEGCAIAPTAIVPENNVVIGDNVTLEHYVVLHENVRIGNNCIVRSGSIIGGQGFEFKRGEDCVLPVAHAGGVVLENDVEVQNHCSIDRAVYPWDDTRIGAHSKLNSGVHIDHANKIGDGALIAAGATVSGCNRIGRDVWIGPGAVISNSLRIGDGAWVSLGAVVTQNVEEGASISGNFAIGHGRLIEHLKKIR